ncbi:MAG: hypothetical protein H5T71_11085 [Chloroflexi bacterium]|nr:hypothetical protein [Chloroflexota bacterium]
MPDWDSPPKLLEIGKSHLLRDGDGGVAFCLGPTCDFALRLSNFRVIDLAFAKPLDVEVIVENAKNFDKIYVFEEGAKIGGVGEEIGSILLSYGIQPRDFRIFAIPDRFIEHGDRKELLEELFALEERENR